MGRRKNGEKRYLCAVQYEWLHAEPISFPGSLKIVYWYQPSEKPGTWTVEWEHEDKEWVSTAVKKAGLFPSS